MSKKKANAPVAGVPGSDPTISSTPIEFGGRTRHLSFDWNAIRQAEIRTGLNLFGAVDFGKLDATNFQALLFAALIPDANANDEKITFEQVGKWIKFNEVKALLWSLATAWTGSKPDPADIEDENPQQAE